MGVKITETTHSSTFS